MQLPTIHQLRLAGFKVKLDHYRRVQLPLIGRQPLPADFIGDRSEPEWRECRVTRLAKKAREFAAIAPKGGRTELAVRAPDGKEGKAVAVCYWQDRFCRKLGARVCISRLITDGVIPAKLEVAS